MDINKLTLAVDFISHLSTQKPQPVIQQAIHDFYGVVAVQLRTLFSTFAEYSVVFNEEELAQIHECETYLPPMGNAEIIIEHDYTDENPRAASLESSRTSSPTTTITDEPPVAQMLRRETAVQRKRVRRQPTQQTAIVAIMHSLRSSVNENEHTPETMENPDAGKIYDPAEVKAKLKMATVVINQLHRTTLQQAFIFGNWIASAQKTFVKFREQFESNSFLTEATRITQLHHSQISEYARFYRCFREFPRIANCVLPLSYFSNGVAERIYTHLKENPVEAAFWSRDPIVDNADVSPQEANNAGRNTALDKDASPSLRTGPATDQSVGATSSVSIAVPRQSCWHQYDTRFSRGRISNGLQLVSPNTISTIDSEIA